MHQRYTTFQRGAARGVCIPELEPHLDFFVREFHRWSAAQPVKIFLERPNRVFSVKLPIEDRAVVVKEFGWRSAIHKLARPLTGSKAVRSFRIAMSLREAGLATPRPLIAWDRKGGGTAFESYYISEEIPDAVTLRQILKSPGMIESERGTLLTELARLGRGMHDAGIFHRDLTISNFLVAPKPVDGKRIFIIDLSRSVHLGRVPLLIRFMDLARMKLGDLWPDFFAAYCTGRPNWKAQRPILNFLIRLRRWKMDLRKKLKV
jgi:tRNA A-37 threonylcarbamoyl transferase component Bud32